MKRILATLAALSITALSATAQAYDVNKDLVLSGTGGAKGVCVELKGIETITETYNGYPSGTFSPPTITVTPDGNTRICWCDYSDGTTDNQIDVGELIHVGWSTADGTNEIVNMYYTDGCGNNPLADSKIENITPKVTPVPGGTNSFDTSWTNDNSIHPVQLNEIRFAILEVPVELAQLNLFDPFVNSVLQPVPGPQNTVLFPGNTFQLPPLPLPPPGGSVVFAFQMSGPGSAAMAFDYVQVTFDNAAPCPEDLNGDGFINQSDLAQLLAHYGFGSGGDVDGDGDTDQADLAALLARYGQPCP